MVSKVYMLFREKWRFDKGRAGAFHSENQMIVQASQWWDPSSYEQLEQMAPPPQLRINLSLISKPRRQLLQTRQGWDYSNDWGQYRRNRLVLGLSLMWSIKWLERVVSWLISRWLTIHLVSLCKNGSETKRKLKFDIIKKIHGSVFVKCRVNNFTRDLTMNVQDVQEVVHYERKDLMPEGGERR